MQICLPYLIYRYTSCAPTLYLAIKALSLPEVDKTSSTAMSLMSSRVATLGQEQYGDGRGKKGIRTRDIFLCPAGFV